MVREHTIREDFTPLECLQLVLDNVDYTRHACHFTEMVGACLPTQVLDICHKVIEREKNNA